MIKKLTLLSLCAFSLSALTLQEVVDLALKNSTKLQEVSLNQEKTTLIKEQKQSARYGEFNLVGSFDHYNLPRTLAPLTPSTISPTIATTDNLFNVGINYSVPLFTGFAQTKNIEIEELQKSNDIILEKLTKEQIIYDVKTIYLSTLSLEDQLNSLNSYAKAQTDLLNIIHTEVALGKKAYIDELKAMSDLEGIKSIQQTLISNIEIFKASLKYFINQDVGDLTTVVFTNEEPTIEGINDLARIKAMDMSLKMLDEKIAVQQSSRYPQVSLNASYGQNFGYNDAKNPNPGDFNNQELWQIGLKLQYKLYDFDADRLGVEATKVEKLQNQIKKEDVKRALEKELSSSISKFHEAKALYGNAKTKYKLLVQTQKIEKVRYENDAITINDLLFANAQTEIAKSQMIDAAYNCQKTIFLTQYLLEKGNK